jgi:S-adenosylmethionine:tRNA ribosyltransferase-isomerase
VPLPPYLGRYDVPSDTDRYQTVYASRDGAVAAPTAGLHLTKGLLGRLQERGAQLGRLTLHVGLGTFRPVTVDDLDDHPMHAEWFEVDSTLAEAVQAARARRGPVVAVAIRGGQDW